MTPESLLLFTLAGLLLNLTPGPDVLYVVTHALRQGVRAGLWAAWGITAGCFVHIVAATVGVSALLAASATAFAVLKWVGAAYLVYVGVAMLHKSTQPPAAWPVDAGGVAPALSVRVIFWRGFWTNALNPKVALFFLAFLPQFIGPSVTQKSLAFLGLGLLFTFNGMWVNMAWAWMAAALARKATGLQRAMRWLDRLAGALFVTFGVRLALIDTPAT